MNGAIGSASHTKIVIPIRQAANREIPIMKMMPNANSISFTRFRYKFWFICSIPQGKLDYIKF